MWNGFSSNAKHEQDLKYQLSDELPFCWINNWNEENACCRVELNLRKMNCTVSYEISKTGTRWSDCIAKKNRRKRELTNAGSKIWKGDLIWIAEREERSRRIWKFNIFPNFTLYSYFKIDTDTKNLNMENYFYLITSFHFSFELNWVGVFIVLVRQREYTYRCL